MEWGEPLADASMKKRRSRRRCRWKAEKLVDKN
jgi:hypothetical protein